MIQTIPLILVLAILKLCFEIMHNDHNELRLGNVFMKIFFQVIIWSVSYCLIHPFDFRTKLYQIDTAPIFFVLLAFLERSFLSFPRLPLCRHVFLFELEHLLLLQLLLFLLVYHCRHFLQLLFFLQILYHRIYCLITPQLFRPVEHRYGRAKKTRI